MIEVRANLSFSSSLGFLLAGAHYQVNPRLQAVQALIAGGYLTPTDEGEGNDAMDPVGADVLLGVGVGPGVAGREEETEEDVDGQGGVEPA